MEPLSRDIMAKTDMEISVLVVSCFQLIFLFIMHICLAANCTVTKPINFNQYV